MDYNVLLDLSIKLGYRLAVAGAETFRIEESITRILKSYEISSETFAIPNCLTVSITMPDGNTMTRMCRIGFHGNDLDSVERYSNLSRRICTEKPEPHLALEWLRQEDACKKQYTYPVYLIGNFLGAFGFGIFFGGTFKDAICAGICGLLVGVISRILNQLKVNPFFSTITSAFLMAVLAYGMAGLHIPDNTDKVIIGTLMILLPGLIFTNAMRDIIFGDTNSGINRIVQMLMISSAIALGTATAYNLTSLLWVIPPAPESLPHPYMLQILAAFIGCIGFEILFNIHGPGGLLCALGGAITWGSYCIAVYFYKDVIAANFIGAVVAAIYAESMARIRKFPAISYLVVSIFPLIPGSGIYYSSNYIVQGQMTDAGNKSMETIAIAGAIAVGILMVSTIVRHWCAIRYKLKMRASK